MRATNRVSLVGNLGADVEISGTSGLENGARGGEGNLGSEIARLSVAESYQRKNEATGVYEHAHTNWIPITAFGQLALRAHRDLKKGDRVTILGTLKTTSYEKDGEPRKGFEVIADSIERAVLLLPYESAASDLPAPLAGAPTQATQPIPSLAPSSGPVVIQKQSVQLSPGRAQVVQPPRGEAVHAPRGQSSRKPAPVSARRG